MLAAERATRRSDDHPDTFLVQTTGSSDLSTNGEGGLSPSPNGEPYVVPEGEGDPRFERGMGNIRRGISSA